MSDPIAAAERRRIAEAVRAACIEAAQRAYEQASVSGLCAEGALEAAVGAVRMLDLEAVIGRMAGPHTVVQRAK